MSDELQEMAMYIAGLMHVCWECGSKWRPGDKEWHESTCRWSSSGLPSANLDSIDQIIQEAEAAD